MNKKWIIVIIIAMLAHIQASVVKQKQADTEKVKQQYVSDVERKDAIIKKIHALMKEINANVGGEEKLVVPVEPSNATDVVDHDEYAKKEMTPDKKPEEDKKGTKESLIAPTKGKMTGKYGYRENPVTKKYSFHKGIDIAAPKGTKVVASAHGIVASSQYMNNGYGNCIIIEHENNIKTLYAHLEKRLVKPGEVVQQGQQIGTVGATGRATGPHLHYEVYKGKQPVNPEELMHY
ncbi:MAG: M23 family metallopeptidase [Spirochaetota bacterium]|nr:M23 family metallopeptidase [Spirochaetota bacterium]